MQLGVKVESGKAIFGEECRVSVMKNTKQVEVGDELLTYAPATKRAQLRLEPVAKRAKAKVAPK